MIACETPEVIGTRDAPVAVSVIVPNYNHARYLPRRLSSILGQTFADFEVIFLDDASTDNSMEVFVTFAEDARVRLIRNPENSGSPFRQWNRGVREARGKYVWIAESDDYSQTDFLQTMLESLRTHPEAGLAYCQSWMVDENDQTLQRYDEYDRSLSGGRWAVGFVNDGKAETRDQLIYRNTIPNASAVVFSREIFERAGGANEQLRLCGDWATWISMLMHCGVIFHPEPLNYFRIGHMNSQRFLAKREALDVLEGLEILQQVSQGLELSESEYERAFYAHVSRWAMYAVAFRYSPALNYRIYRRFEALREDSRLRLASRFSIAVLRNVLQKVSQLAGQ